MPKFSLQKGLRHLGASLLFFIFANSPAIADSGQSQQQPATVVLIIDDMGNGMELGRRAVALPGPINYAFLPHSPNGRALAETAHQQGKEIMLHVPMSNLLDHDTGPGALRPIMNHRQFQQTMADNLQSIPHVRGVNNHMGSLLTQLREPMDWVMATLKQNNLYFIDSRTSPLSVAESQAQSHQLPNMARDIFLDNQRNEAAISVQFERLISLAKQHGIAVAIGHPHPETLAFLEQALPTLSARGVKLALASSVFSPGLAATSDCATTATSAKQVNDCAKPLLLAKAKNDKYLTE